MDAVILIVDDEELVLSVAELLLRRAGLDVLTAESGPAALRLFQARASEITCVLLDLSMPEMSGLEVLEAMRAIRPDTPVIISSGYSEQPLSDANCGENIVGILRKPYDGRQLLDAVHAALKTIDARRSNDDPPLS